MLKNVGCVDRAIRIVGGCALIIAAFSGYLGPWAYIGAIPLLAGLVGSCPLYRLVGMNTNRGGCHGKRCG